MEEGALIPSLGEVVSFSLDSKASESLSDVSREVIPEEWDPIGKGPAAC